MNRRIQATPAGSGGQARAARRVRWRFSASQNGCVPDIAVNIDGHVCRAAAYIADNKFRHRDPRYSTADRHKERFNKEIAKRFDRAIIFQPRDFTVSPDKSFCICPAGKRMYKCGNAIHNGLHAIKYHGTKRDCIPCLVRAKCMKNPAVTVTRQFAHFTGRTEKKDKTFTQKMREKIDSVAGKMIYGRRMATVEPVFADIRANLGLDHFSLRGNKKVSIQWRLYCIVHNLLKVHRAWD